MSESPTAQIIEHRYYALIRYYFSYYGCPGDQIHQFSDPSSKVEKIDKLAGAQHCDRSYILNEVIDQYLDVQNYHTNLIEQGVRDSEEGKTVSHEEVGRRLAKQRVSRPMKSAR